MREQFNQTEKAIIPIAAFAASGDIENLKMRLNNGLDLGLTVNEIKSVLVQMYAYCGFPRSLNALNTLMTVVAERKDQGINDVQGNASTVSPVVEKSVSVGTKNQTKLVGEVVTGPLYEFAPAIDAYLKAHLFCDIFEDDVLSWKQRELATLSALSTMQGVNSQLHMHYFISLNNGMTADLLSEFITIVQDCCGSEIANNANDVLQNVLNTIEDH